MTKQEIIDKLDEMRKAGIEVGHYNKGMSKAELEAVYAPFASNVTVAPTESADDQAASDETPETETEKDETTVLSKEDALTKGACDSYGSYDAADPACTVDCPASADPAVIESCMILKQRELAGAKPKPAGTGRRGGRPQEGSRRGTIIDMLLEGTHTKKDILDALVEKFGEEDRKRHSGAIGGTIWDLRNKQNRIVSEDPDTGICVLQPVPASAPAEKQAAA